MPLLSPAPVSVLKCEEWHLRTQEVQEHLPPGVGRAGVPVPALLSSGSQGADRNRGHQGLLDLGRQGALRWPLFRLSLLAGRPWAALDLFFLEAVLIKDPRALT